MSFGVYMFLDIRPTLQMLNAVQGELKRWPAGDLAELATLAQLRIKRRTQRGQTMFGGKFTYYSEEWAQEREERGRQTDHVDLLFSGKMYAAMTVGVSGRAGTISFTDQREADKAMGHHHGLGKLPERPWFGVAEGTPAFDDLMEEASFLMHRRIENLGTFS